MSPLALIGAYDEDGNRHRNTAPSWQRYLEHLESTVVGEPGRPRAVPEPFEPQEAAELVDGIAPAPEPAKPKRKRRKVKPGPALDRDSVNLARYARKLRGEP